MVGLVGIDLCLAEVKELGLTDESQIAEELIERVKKRNYIPGSAGGEYAEALLAEYKKQFQPEGEESSPALITIEIQGTGCKNCNALVILVRDVVIGTGY